MMYKLSKILIAAIATVVTVSSYTYPIKQTDSYIKQALCATDGFLLKYSNLHRTMNGLPAKSILRTRNVIIVTALAGCTLWQTNKQRDEKTTQSKSHQLPKS